MDSPNKRMRKLSPGFDAQDDFVSLGTSNDGHDVSHSAHTIPSNPFARGRAPAESYRRSANGFGHSSTGRDRRFDQRGQDDRPKSRHVLPGYEPWILVKTKLSRKFVHNLETKESLWRIPKHVLPGVKEFEQAESVRKEKMENARWAEQQLQSMKEQQRRADLAKPREASSQTRRRRSESLQREDEEALMAELAAEYAKEAPASQPEVTVVQPPVFLETADDSDGSYEEVEVTDSEFEDGDDPAGKTGHDTGPGESQPDDTEPHDQPVEFGEDDIAYQLAAMGEEYGLDAGEFGDDDGEDLPDGAEGLPFTHQDAIHLFRDLLDDHQISPFVPWDKVLADESENSILHDDRYTVLTTMRARKDAFDDWAKDKAALIRQQRAAMEKRDPKIPYLAFLHERASPKLYWPEFKRKYKREPEMNDRNFSDKDREKLYRDHISRVKLPESRRKADLQVLLDSIPLQALNRQTTLDTLPQQLLSHLHYISLGPAQRDSIISNHIKRLAPAPDEDSLDDELRAERQKQVEGRQRREQALAERARKVDEDRRRIDKDDARAKRELWAGEQELRHATSVPNKSM